MKNKMIALALVAAASIAPALAGGPLLLADPTTRTPYAYHMGSWPASGIPVYTDLGALGRLSNNVADSLVSFSFNQWTSVPTASLTTTVAGDFGSLGLPDIVCPNGGQCNADLIVGTNNGGGIHVIYDNDGTILQNFFGVSRFGILGISSPEWAVSGTNEVTESWTILNGFIIPASDPNGLQFAGVITHETGHAIGLAHTQTNGARAFFADPAQPAACAAPYPNTLSVSQIETMFPFLSISATGSGIAQSTVDQIDDMAALSDLYPEAGWPDSRGTIRGTVTVSRRARVSSANDLTEVTGINVVARNIANPSGDASSSITGQYTQGKLGPDGSFTINGLTPGATYALYLDAIASGGYSTPYPLVIPARVEYYNGQGESADGATDDRCVWTTIAVAAASPVTADMTFNRVKGMPEFIPLLPGVIPTDVSADGSIVVGIAGTTNNIRWTEAGGYESLGGVSDSGQPGISADGTVIVANARDANGVKRPAIWAGGTDWTTLPSIAGAVPCGTGTSASFGSAYDVSGDGSTVVGLAYNGCGFFNAFSWSAATGVQLLPRVATRGNRANAVNYDGSVVVGWDDFSGRAGMRWENGVASTMSPSPSSYFVGEAASVTPDGSRISGVIAGTPRAGWRWSGATGVEEIGIAPGLRDSAAADLSDDGSVVVGYSTINNAARERFAAIWTQELGWTDFTSFLNAQGAYAVDWFLRTNIATTGDANTILGWAQTRAASQQGYIVRLPKVVLCHAPPTNPSNAHTIDASFPDGMASHLAHGDTVGLCQHGGL